MTWPARAERAGEKKLWEISMEQLEIISGGDLPRHRRVRACDIGFLPRSN